MGNVSANENNKFYSPVVELYEKAESRVVQFFNNLIDLSRISVVRNGEVGCKIVIISGT